jgi:serine/threonine protein kinase/alpha-tubulin suppressor-like RCC1 family protein
MTDPAPDAPAPLPLSSEMPPLPPPLPAFSAPVPGVDVRWPRELDSEYECVGELGRGGMAIVYHARDRELHRDVAVKVVRTRYAHDQEAVARLAREARTVAHLEHPNLVALHAVKRLSDDSLALVMQLVPGKTLKQTLRDEGAFNADRVERVLRDIARGLAYAHARGIVHRDVKPENIFLDAETGRALLSDFGVAISRESDTSLTATGTAIGTPTYMSPEQIDGARVDGRSDLYSLGLVAWEMLTGRRPWDGESLYSVIYRQKHEELLSIDELRPDVSERLRYLIDGLLRKQPASRWASAERFLGRLNDATDPPGLKQWRQYKKKQAKARREALKALPNENSLPEAPTEHFRRSAEQRAIKDEKLDARSTPQTIRVETSAAAVDEWSVEDDGSTQRRRRYPVWLAAGVLAAVAGAVAFVLFKPDPAPSTEVADKGRSTFSDAGTIEVPVVKTDSIANRRDSLSVATPPLQQPNNPPVTARRESTQVTRPTPTPQPVTPPVTPPQNVVAQPQPTRDSVPVIVPNEPVVPRVNFPTERGVVAAGARHSCAIANGKAQCWGNNENGQLGGIAADFAPTPVSVAGDFAFVQVSAGETYTCGVTADGEGLCWGNNDAGQLGDGTTTTRTAPVRVSGGHSFQLIRSGRMHACGLTRSGNVVCWGSNASGQLGDGSRASRTSPVRVSLPGSAGQLAAGGAHACALLMDGSAFCWGNNTYGQLGDSTKTARSEPVRVASPQTFMSVTAGRSHTCAVTPENDAFCWGLNSNGQAGIGVATEAVIAPQKVETSATLRTVAAGLNHTCALTTGGTAYCWGANNFGQLGDGTKNRHTRPTAVQGAGALVALFPGSSHTCGRNGGGEVFCWGYNIDGQLGSGGREDSIVPIKVQDSPR